MRAALYLRVSTAEQAEDGFSLRSQKDKLTKFANSQDWDIADYYIEEGVSAKNMVRPELNRMIADIEKKKIDVVLVYRLDRITRSVRDLYNILELLEKHECKFRSATEVYDTSSALGRMFITLVASFAQFERETLGERVTVNMVQMVQEGKWPGGTTPYGYMYDPESKVFTINPDHAPIVKMVFELYLTGVGILGISRQLNDMGSRRPSGVKWVPKNIIDILKNPVHAGKLKYKDVIYDDFVDPIIDTITFEQAEKLREAKGEMHSRRAGPSAFPFSGVLVCGRCGKPMNGTTSKVKRKNGDIQIYKHYYCPGFKNKTGCDMGNINELAVEYAFLERLKLDMKQYDRIAKEEAKSKPKMSKADKKKAQLKRELTQVKNRKREWQLLLGDRKLTFEDYSERVKEDIELEESLKQQLNEMQPTEEKVINPAEIAEAIRIFIDNWNNITVEEKKTPVRLLLEHVTIDAEDKRGNRAGIRKAFITSISYR